MTLITHKGKVEEGLIFNKYIEGRLVEKNQNLLSAVTGSTGSGKSYTCLRICELWYKRRFNKPFPPENITFSIKEIMRRLTSGELKPTELLINEESGTQLNSLDFQNQVSKLFTFTLQSFRNMRIGIIMNLPVLTMLNKTARLLLHTHFITSKIDYENKICKLRPYFLQLNQKSGKMYEKFLRVKINGKVRRVERFNYSLPSPELIKVYEEKKFKFVNDLNKKFLDKLNADDKEEERKMARAGLTFNQNEVFDMLDKGYSVRQLCDLRGCSTSNLYEIIRGIRHKGYIVKISRKGIEKKEFEGETKPPSLIIN